MKKFSRAIALILLFSFFLSINSRVSLANNTEIVLDEEDFRLEKEKGKGFLNLVFKRKDLTNEEIKNVYKKIDSYQQQRFMAEVSFGVIVVTFLYTLYNTEVRPYFELERENKQKIEAVKNGWVSVEQSGYTTWYYKESGNFKKGWYYDDYYKGWYYFVEMEDGEHFMFNPKYFKSKWLRINNKWYEFEIGGKLKELTGWREYSKGKYLYHLEKDFGSPAYAIAKVGSYWYYFDSDGLTNRSPVDPAVYNKLSN